MALLHLPFQMQAKHLPCWTFRSLYLFTVIIHPVGFSYQKSNIVVIKSKKYKICGYSYRFHRKYTLKKKKKVYLQLMDWLVILPMNNKNVFSQSWTSDLVIFYSTKISKLALLQAALKTGIKSVLLTAGDSGNALDTVVIYFNFFFFLICQKQVVLLLAVNSHPSTISSHGSMSWFSWLKA